VYSVERRERGVLLRSAMASVRYAAVRFGCGWECFWASGGAGFYIVLLEVVVVYEAGVCATL
jgi:hypothetical protein